MILRHLRRSPASCSRSARVLFHAGSLTATTQTAFWCVIFFFASAGASSAYLTVSEIFPLELRGQAISYFFAIVQLAGGVAAPCLFGQLIGEGERTRARSPSGTSSAPPS